MLELHRYPAISFSFFGGDPYSGVFVVFVVHIFYTGGPFMKRLLKSKVVLSVAAFFMIAAAIVVPLSGSITHSFAASRSSHNIAYVNYDDSGFTGSSIPSANIFTDAIVGGPSPTSSPTDSVTYNGMT